GQDDGDLDTHWEQAQRARWVAEEALRRLEKAGPPLPGQLQTVVAYNNVLQLAYLYAGYANRLLGENMCEAVIDSSAAQPNAVYFTRAESLFTKAIAVTGGTPATILAQATAAYAGRAAVRVYLGNWAGAITDANQVAIGFVYNMPYFNIGDDAQRNRIFYSSGTQRAGNGAHQGRGPAHRRQHGGRDDLHKPGENERRRADDHGGRHHGCVAAVEARTRNRAVARGASYG